MLAGLRLNAPRFDTGWQALWNVFAIAVFVVVIVLVVRHIRAGRRMSAWDWVLILLHISIGGVYLPIGPLIWLGRHGGEQRRAMSQGPPG